MLLAISFFIWSHAINKLYNARHTYTVQLHRAESKEVHFSSLCLSQQCNLSLSLMLTGCHKAIWITSEVCWKRQASRKMAAEYSSAAVEISKTSVFHNRSHSMKCTLKAKMHPIKRSTANTRHMLFVDIKSSLYGKVPGCYNNRQTELMVKQYLATLMHFKFCNKILTNCWR